MPLRARVKTGQGEHLLKIGDWINSCDPIVNVVNLDYDVGIDISIEVDKLEKTLKALSKLVGDKQIQKAVDDVKGVVPGGEFRLVAGILLDPDPPKSVPCPNDPSCAAMLYYNVYVVLQVHLKVSAGAVSGGGHFTFRYRLASGYKQCTCPKKKETAYLFRQGIGTGVVAVFPAGIATDALFERTTIAALDAATEPSALTEETTVLRPQPRSVERPPSLGFMDETRVEGGSKD